MTPLPQNSESDEDFLSTHEMPVDEYEDSDVDSAVMEPPRHPAPAMQAAFEESILESTEDAERPRSQEGTAETRRKKVLEAGHYDDSWTARWSQKAGARHHPLMKLMAQIVFGMHLLQQEAAKSDEEVVKILQTHVDEVDNFLEKTMEDFDLAMLDIEERIRYLKLPMKHVHVFEAMLEDKKFRTQLLDGNDKIEKIIDRTSRAMNAALLDVREGKVATRELGEYLDNVTHDVSCEKPDWDAIYSAMRDNEQGWKQCLKDLQAKGAALSEALLRLASVISEMSRIAAAVSRRQRPHSRSESAGLSSMTSTTPRSKFSSPTHKSRAPSVGNDKPLPKEPSTKAGAGPPIAYKQHPIAMAQRYESPRPAPLSSHKTTTTPTERPSSRSGSAPSRPRTAGSVKPDRQWTVSKSNTADLADFFRDSGPDIPRRRLHKNSTTPDSKRSASTTIERKPRERAGVDVIDHAKSLSGSPKAIGRSKTLDSKSATNAPTPVVHSRTMSSQTQPPMPVTSVEKSANEEKASLSGMRFAKRLSIRRKDFLQSPPITAPSSATATTPPLTALTSNPPSTPSPEKNLSPADSKLQPISETNSTPPDISRRKPVSDLQHPPPPPPRLGLFPTDRPLTPSAAASTADRSNSMMENRRVTPSSADGRPFTPAAAGGVAALREKSGSGGAAPSVMTTSTKKSRAFSIRRLFRGSEKS